jgi:hypothetical protein
MESQSASHDEAYDDYDEHQDDISSVSGDNSTKFNVKVPLASEHVSPIVSPITPSVGNTVSLNPNWKLLFFLFSFSVLHIEAYRTSLSTSLLVVEDGVFAYVPRNCIKKNKRERKSKKSSKLRK